MHRTLVWSSWKVGMMTKSKAIQKIRSRIKQKEWLYEVIASKEAGKMSNRLAEMLFELTCRYANRVNFVNYPYKDEMIAHALMQLCKSWHYFKPEKSDNPFAYYTQCIKGSFAYILNSEKRQKDIKKDYSEYLDDGTDFW